MDTICGVDVGWIYLPRIFFQLTWSVTVYPRSFISLQFHSYSTSSPQQTSTLYSRSFIILSGIHSHLQSVTLKCEYTVDRLPVQTPLFIFFLLLFFSTRWLAWGRHCASKSAYRKANSSTKSACWPSQTWQLWHTQTATRPIQTHALSIKWLHNPSQWSLWDAKGSYLFTLSKTFKLSQRKKCYPFIHIFSENNIWMWFTVEIHYSSAAAFQQTFNNMHFDWSQQEMQIIYILFVMVQFH